MYHSLKLVPLGLIALAGLAAALWWAGITPVSSDEPAARVPGIPLSELDSRLQGAAPEQAEALADGRVTLDEYRDALDLTRACVEAGGLAVTFAEPVGGVVQLSVAAPAGMDPSRSDQIFQSCVTAHLRAVGQAWALQTRPDEPTLQAARDVLGSCLRAAGVAGVPEHPTQAELGTLSARGLTEFGPCSEQAGEQFNLPAFGG